MPSCCSGTFSVYCEDIDEFEKEWKKINNFQEQIERFGCSKAGEIITDYYSDDPKLNIVQQDCQAKIVCDKKVDLYEKEIIVHNGYGCPSYVYFARGSFEIKYVSFLKKFYKLVKYKLYGGCVKSIADKNLYFPVHCWGNKILKCSISEDNAMNKSQFKNDTVESIAYYPLTKTDTWEELKNMEASLTDEELDLLLCDIPGEAG